MGNTNSVVPWVKSRLGLDEPEPEQYVIDQNGQTTTPQRMRSQPINSQRSDVQLPGQPMTEGAPGTSTTDSTPRPPITTQPGSSDGNTNKPGSKVKKGIKHIKDAVASIDKDKVKAGAKVAAGGAKVAGKVCFDCAQQGGFDAIPYANIVCFVCKCGILIGHAIWKVKKNEKKVKKMRKKMMKGASVAADGEVLEDIENAVEGNDSSSSDSSDSSDSDDENDGPDLDCIGDCFGGEDL